MIKTQGKRKSVIIIGSGIGGLVAGNLLAKKGYKVTMFESHSMPGGYTAGFFREGFYFESGTFSFESSRSTFEAMKNIGVLDKIQFVRQPHGFVAEDFKSYADNYNRFKKDIYSSFPSDKDKLDTFFCHFDKSVKLAEDVVAKPHPVFYSGLRYFIEQILYIPVIVKYIRLLNLYKDMSVLELAEKYFGKDSRFYRIINSMSYPDMGPGILAASAHSLLKDYWTVEDGMQSWANILAENFIKLGGNLKLNSYVDRIITKNGCALGVSCKNKKYFADYVISAGDYKKTFLDLLDDKTMIPQEKMTKIKNSPVSEGFFTVYLGLDMPNHQLKEYMKEPHITYLCEKPGCDIYNPSDEAYFEKSSIIIYSPSMVNPMHAPQGKSSLIILNYAPNQWMDNWGGGERARYSQLKNIAMEAVIEKASKIIPDLRKFVIYKDSATPLTYERFTHNTAGASSAWSWNPKRKFYNHPLNFTVKTPVKNLYISSAWAGQLGGVPGAIIAAYQFAKEI